jgi:hypothetical protein
MLLICLSLPRRWFALAAGVALLAQTEARGASASDGGDQPEYSGGSSPAHGSSPPAADGGAGVDAAGNDAVVLSAGEDNPRAVAVYGPDVYWTNDGLRTGTWEIRKMPKTGGTAKTLEGGGEFGNTIMKATLK